MITRSLISLFVSLLPSLIAPHGRPMLSHYCTTLLRLSACVCVCVRDIQSTRSVVAVEWLEMIEMIEHSQSDSSTFIATSTISITVLLQHSSHR